jgi:hypothetical protein
MHAAMVRAGDATAGSLTSLNSIVSNTQAKENVVDGDAMLSSTLAKSTNGCRTWQRRI